VISINSFLNVLKYCASRCDFKVGSIPFCNHLLCVATPAGHLLVWQTCAWIHPILIIASRDTLIQSAPIANAIDALAGNLNLPLPTKTILSVRSLSLKTLYN